MDVIAVWVAINRSFPKPHAAKALRLAVSFYLCFGASVSRAQPIDRSRFFTRDFPIDAIVGRDCLSFCMVSNKQIYHIK